MPFAGATVPCSIVLLLLLLLGASPPCHGEAPTHDITAILAASPDFSDFSAALAAANLTGQIDGGQTITVLAVDNAAMGRLRAQGLLPVNLGRVLSLHILLDYFDGPKLKALNGTSPTQAASLYQASGAAPGSAGIVNILKGSDGRVAFSADAATGVFYQKSIEESPYDIAVLQVSDAISSPAAEGKAPAPVAAPAPAPVGAPSPTNHTSPPPKPTGQPAPPPKQAGKPAPPPKPVGKPAPPPKLAGEPASPPKPVDTPVDTPADAPEADDQPPADEEGRHKNGAAGTAPWSLGAAAAAVVLLL